MENVEIKGTKKKATKSPKGKVVRKEDPAQEDGVSLSQVESRRSKPSSYLVSQIKKMSKEEKEIAISFMEKRNEARVAARMEPAYSQADMDLYK